MIHQLIENIFNAYDDDGSGFLDRAEFHRVFQDLVGELGMNPDYAKRLSDEVLDATDTNADGKVSKAEFTPLAVDIVSAIIDEAENHKFEEEQNSASNPAAATNYVDAAHQILVHDLTREELTAALADIFNSADEDGNGTLDREEFARCLQDVSVDLTDDEINYLLANVDENDDGVIDFKEFQPVAFNLLLQVMAEEMKEQVCVVLPTVADTNMHVYMFSKYVFPVYYHSLTKTHSLTSYCQTQDENAFAAAQWNADTLSQARELVSNLSTEELAETLESIFVKADADGNGTLDQDEFRNCLEQTELGLTPDVVNALAAKVCAGLHVCLTD